MTRVRVTYIAIDDEGVPIASAETQEHLKEALDIYYGVEKGAAKCEGWFPFQTEYPDDYEGYYKYSWSYNVGDVIDEGKDMVKVYCINFHPHTEYDIKEAQKKLITEVMNEDAKDGLYNIPNEQTKASVEKVKEYQNWLREIPELSDEEIKEKMFGGQFDDQDDDDLSMLFGAKWYREQVKRFISDKSG